MPRLRLRPLAGELIDLRWQPEDEINALEDVVAVLDPGETGGRGTAAFPFLGVHPTLPSSGATVI